MSALPVPSHRWSLPSWRALPVGRRLRRPVAAPAPDALPVARIGARRRLVLAMAAFTTVIEVLHVADLVPGIRIGALDLSLAIIPALGLAVVCGDRLLGRSTDRRFAIGYWAVIAVLLPVLGIVFLQRGRGDVWVSLLAASAGEEMVYRLAAPAVIALILRAGKVRADWARIGGLVLAGLWFVLLPGHREQMDSVAQALPFVAFAALSALLVYRSGSILPMAAGHAVINMSTVLMWNEAVAADERGMALTCVLGGLVIAYGRPRRLTVSDDGGLLDTRTGLEVALIDVRDGHPASVTLSDGRQIPVAGNFAGRRDLLASRAADQPAARSVSRPG